MPRLDSNRPVPPSGDVIDNQRVLAAVSAIYGAAAEPDRWHDALQAVADCFDDAGAILIYGRDDGAFGVIESPGMTPLLQEYGRSWSHRDIRAIRCRERGYFIGRDVVTDRDVLTPAEIETDPFYVEFLAKHGLKYFAAAMVSPAPHVEVAMSIQRRADRPEYSITELELVGHIGSHVERALRLTVRLLDAELVNVGLGAALNRVGIGVFALDSLGRIVFSNDAGEAMLGDGIEAVGGHLRFTHSPGRAQAEAALGLVKADTMASALQAPKPVLIRRTRTDRPLVLYVLPVPLEQNLANRVFTQARAIVLLVDPESGGAPDPALIRDILGLTLSEARLAALIGTGATPRSAAERLGITEETARTTLKRVFSKVGVSRQSELATLMSRLLL